MYVVLFLKVARPAMKEGGTLCGESVVGTCLLCAWCQDAGFLNLFEE